MILLLATWVGLVAGWLDLGLMVVNTRLIHRDSYRLGEPRQTDARRDAHVNDLRSPLRPLRAT